VPRFPANFVDDLKAHADILQVIHGVVPLKKSGSTYKGLCPFHKEKTPSFHVNPDKGFFHCFGCATGGDVVKFVELYDKLSFPEAVRSLAQRFGMTVPESDDPERDRQLTIEREALVKLHELARDYYCNQLESKSGSQAREYLDQRELSASTIKKLDLGLAPPRRDALKQHLLDAGQPLELLLKSGLVVQREGGKTVDRFRNRLMVPICRDTGSVIAFGGRSLTPNQQPKYLNSPETPLYSKGRVLYGLHLTKQDIRRLGYAVLVEGYFDFAQAFQAGVKTVIATCGTALTQMQSRLLKRFCTKVLLSFDPDTAGQGASTRSGELLLSEGFQTNVVTLASGEDPDSFVRLHGANSYRLKLKNSQPYLEYVLDQAISGRNLSRETDQRDFLADMLAVAARIPDPASRDHFADRIAHRANVMEDVIRSEIRKAAIAKRTEIPLDVQLARSDLRQAEKGILWATVHNTSAALSVLAGLEPADFETLGAGPILLVARTLIDVPPEQVSDTLLDRLTPEEQTLVKQIAQDPVEPANVEDCAINLRELRYKRERAALQNAIDHAQRADPSESNVGKINTLLEKKRDLTKRLDELLR
jgi:DNA primase|tara:strand:- start:13445 stop:15214 length:1770 start_codon:yes stop_codon:yes gene_type:complete